MKRINARNLGVKSLAKLLKSLMLNDTLSRIQR